jgi:hypothetical protein
MVVAAKPLFFVHAINHSEILHSHQAATNRYYSVSPIFFDKDIYVKKIERCTGSFDTNDLQE